MSIEVAKTYSGGGEFEPVPDSTLLEQITEILGEDHPHLQRNRRTFERLEEADDPIIVLGLLIKGYRDQSRLNAWQDGAKENDVEHSYMLSVTAVELKNKLYPNDPELDDLILKQYAEIHDWIEILVGDTVTLAMSDEDYENKGENEARAIRVLYDFLNRKGLDEKAELFLEYEMQMTKAARFIKAVDKYMPYLTSIVGDAVGPHIEFGIYKAEELEMAFEIDRIRFAARFGEEFPELVPINNHYQDQVLKIFGNVVGGNSTQRLNGTIGRRAVGAGSYVI